MTTLRGRFGRSQPPGETSPQQLPTGLTEFVAELTRHQPRLRGLVRCLLFDRKDAEDVLQDANLTLVRKSADYRPGTDFWAWASQVARYQVLTHCKRLKRDKLVFSADLLATLAESVIGATLQPRLPWLSNELVNGLQTLLAAVLALAVVPWV